MTSAKRKAVEMLEVAELQSRLARLEADNAAETTWGAAVGVRYAEIKAIRKRLRAISNEEAPAPAPVSVGEVAIEQAAIAMWREEARRAGTPGLAKRRTPENWTDQSEETRERWIGLARAALRALSEGEG